MYINPVLFGVLGTLFIEMAVINGIVIYCDVCAAARKKNHKGGQNNG